MHDYETQGMNKNRADRFEAWFDKEIGTDIERNTINDDKLFYFVCSELEQGEVDKIRQWEELEALKTSPAPAFDGDYLPQPKRKGAKTMKIRHTFRANRQYAKDYYDNITKTFAEAYVPAIKALRGIKEVTAIDFAKQDMRGAPSITLFDESHCVPHQIHFASNNEMIAFMQGYLEALQNGMNIAKDLGLE